MPACPVAVVLLCAPVSEEFTGKLLARMDELTVGDPREAGTRIAPLIDEAATQRVLDRIDAARAAGARVLHGGRARGRAIEPTVLCEVPEEQPAWCEEIFDPVVALRVVPDLAAGLAAVNRSRYGLHAAVFTRSLASAFAAIEELEVGGVVVNEVPGFRSDVMPYGGVKDSGVGREGPRFAIEELTVTRMAVVRPS
ncbi:acyl-CoA reductase-like NAD-dependent aldehyde dehydrogenase [Pseudonocardia parietis]|uniref:Acyl-CoA reductase-like NAD-dependent aldehyde dehydrogenase n=1 Tax=Pseudonocardia parietis TaxID=570936 RepID=A0ABS4VVJ7_9PSEU|nr:acyl-CoA reductase-like NAD-dependent aldehyde dehydrogenase [Pseudonocardia parietis]